MRFWLRSPALMLFNLTSMGAELQSQNCFDIDYEKNPIQRNMNICVVRIFMKQTLCVTFNSDKQEVIDFTKFFIRLWSRNWCCSCFYCSRERTMSVNPDCLSDFSITFENAIFWQKLPTFFHGKQKINNL